MTSVHDVVKRGRCVDPARVPCDKAKDYLEKKGLLCSSPKPQPAKRPAKKRKGKGFFEDWFG